MNLKLTETSVFGAVLVVFALGLLLAHAWILFLLAALAGGLLIYIDWRDTE